MPAFLNISRAIAMLALASLFSACSGSGSGSTPPAGGGPGGTTGSGLRFTSISVSGTTTEPARVTIGGRLDEETHNDQTFTVAFALGGPAVPGSLAADDGTARNYRLPLTVTPMAGGAARSSELVISLEP